MLGEARLAVAVVTLCALPSRVILLNARSTRHSWLALHNTWIKHSLSDPGLSSKVSDRGWWGVGRGTKLVEISREFYVRPAASAANSQALGTSSKPKATYPQQFDRPSTKKNAADENACLKRSEPRERGGLRQRGPTMFDRPCRRRK